MMRRGSFATLCTVAAVIVGAVLLAGSNSAAAGTAGMVSARTASGGTWGTAEEVPGSAALNAGGFAYTEVVSCPSAGYCSAGGTYTDASGQPRVFLVKQAQGSWRTATQIRGALVRGHRPQLIALSCTSGGDCSAGGQYSDAAGNRQAFVVTETDGTWSGAEEVPGTAALNAGGVAYIQSVSCASAGNCSAVGSYTDAAGNTQVFLVDQTSGTWGTAEEVPGTAVLNAGGLAYIESVSCASAGYCSAGGSYADAAGDNQAFIVDETGGTWGTAEGVPGIAALQGVAAGIESVSCASAGNCGAGGTYTDAAGQSQAFAVSETDGVWGDALEVPGIAALNAGEVGIASVSCASAGNCGAGGTYTDAAGTSQVFVVTQTGGTWGTAEEVPGTAALNAGGNAQISSVSCGAAGNCSAGGWYTDSSKHQQAFVVSQTNGRWRSAVEVPGTAALNQGGFAYIVSVSCASAGHCTAGGAYTDSSKHRQAFVVTES